MGDWTIPGIVTTGNAFPSDPGSPEAIGDHEIALPPANPVSRPPENRVTASRAAASHGRRRGMVAFLAAGVCIAWLAAIIALPKAAAAQASNEANFLGEPLSDTARHVADRVVALHDNRGLPFIIIDKVNAAVFLFNDQGQLRGATRALLGLARGDDSVAGIGTRKMSSIRPEERTTPAGRFVASLGHDSSGRSILWVDYADNIALHRVVTSNPKEHRLERLTLGSSLDRRISYGCINVPVEFFEKLVIPAFTGTKGIVYIMPETRSVGEGLFSESK